MTIMAKSRQSGVLIALAVFVAVAVALKLFGSPLYAALIRLHGSGGGGH